MNKKLVLEKIEKKEIVVGVVGLGICRDSH